MLGSDHSLPLIVPAYSRSAFRIVGKIDERQLAQCDRIGRSGRAAAIGGTALPADVAGMRQIAHDLGQMAARDAKFVRDFVGRKAPPQLSCEPHHRARPQIGKGREAHGLSTFPFLVLAVRIIKAKVVSEYLIEL